ncbi:MAG: TonB-dependent receptor, partial [Steroidobacteraceae bacterium]
DPGVVNYVAEVPQEFYGNSSILDLASIQVLKGPQGTLFGKNSVGGAVLFVPQKPTKEFEGSAGVRFGNEETREVTGIVNLPVNDVFAMRLAARYSYRGTLVDNISGPDTDSQDRTTGRLSLLFTPNEKLENYFIADGYTSKEFQPNSNVVGAVSQCDFANPRSTACGYQFLAGTSLNTVLAEQEEMGKDKVDQPRARKSWADVWGLTNITTYDFGSVTLKNILGYRHVKENIHQDLDGTRLMLVEQRKQPIKNEQFTEEVQLRGTSFGDKLDWLVGGFYSDLDKYVTDQQTDLFAEFVPSPVILDSHISSKLKAVFGQITYDLGDMVNGLKLTLGARQSWDDREYKGASWSAVRSVATCRNVPPTVPAVLPGTDPLTCVRTLDKKTNKPTWNVNLEYALTDSTFTYITTRRGFKSGSFNVTATGAEFITYDPEILTDVELGVKSQGQVGDLPYRGSLAVYEGKYKDIHGQVPVFENGNFGVYVLNVGDAKVKGVEVELSVIPTPGLELGAYYAYTDGKYDDDLDLPQFAGKALQSVPKTTTGFNTQFVHTLGESVGELALSGNLNYRSKTPTTYDSVDPRFNHVGGYATLNLTAGLNQAFGHNVDVRLYGENVLDKRAPIASNDLRGTVGYAGKSYLEPRMYGVEVNVRFE